MFQLPGRIAILTLEKQSQLQEFRDKSQGEMAELKMMQTPSSLIFYIGRRMHNESLQVLYWKESLKLVQFTAFQ